MAAPESSANQKPVLRHPSRHYVTPESSRRLDDPSRLSARVGLLWPILIHEGRPPPYLISSHSYYLRSTFGAFINEYENGKYFLKTEERLTVDIFWNGISVENLCNKKIRIGEVVYDISSLFKMSLLRKRSNR